MEKRVSFDLVSEPWVPVVLNTAKIAEFGVAETLSRADEIVCLAEESSPTWLGLMGLLVAVVQRAAPPKNDRDWVRILREGWNQEAVSTYLEKWRERFDLFHRTFPFMQGQRLDDDAVVGPATKLTMVHAANTEKRLMNHARNGDPVPLTPAEVAIAVLRTQACAKGGGASADINNKRIELYQGSCFDLPNFSLRGRTLRESIALALLAPDIAAMARGPSANADDAPAWESESYEPTKKALSRDSRGYSDSLTWPTRRIRLNPEVAKDGTVTVTTCRIRQGEFFLAGSKFRGQPWAAYDADNSPTRFSPTQFNRSPAWLSVIEAVSATDGRPPLTIQQARRGLAIDPACLGSNVAVRIAGVEASKSGPILMLYNEEVTVPVRLLLGGEDVGKVLKKIEKSRKFAFASMQSRLTQVRLNGRKPPKKAKAEIQQTVLNSCAMDGFWPEIRDLVIERLAGGADEEWTKGIDSAARRVVKKFSSSLGSAPKTIIGLAMAGT